MVWFWQVTAYFSKAVLGVPSSETGLAAAGFRRDRATMRSSWLVVSWVRMSESQAHSLCDGAGARQTSKSPPGSVSAGGGVYETVGDT